MDYEFEWDENKYIENLKKHHISFEHAALVFDDPYRYEEFDSEHSDDEDRYDVIGMVGDIIFVVVTYKTDNLIRIISARKATKQERRKYYGDY